MYNCDCKKPHILLSVHDVGPTYESIDSALAVAEKIPEVGLSLIVNSKTNVLEKYVSELKDKNIGLHLNLSDEGNNGTEDPHGVFGLEGYIRKYHVSKEKGDEDPVAYGFIEKSAPYISKEIQRQIDIGRELGQLQYVDFHNLFVNHPTVQKAYINGSGENNLVAVWPWEYIGEPPVGNNKLTGKYIDHLNRQPQNEFDHRDKIPIDPDVILEILAKLEDEGELVMNVHIHSGNGEEEYYGTKQTSIFSDPDFVDKMREIVHIVPWDEYGESFVK